MMALQVTATKITFFDPNAGQYTALMGSASKELTKIFEDQYQDGWRKQHPGHEKPYYQLFSVEIEDQDKLTGKKMTFDKKMAELKKLLQKRLSIP